MSSTLKAGVAFLGNVATIAPSAVYNGCKPIDLKPVSCLQCLIALFWVCDEGEFHLEFVVGFSRGAARREHLGLADSEADYIRAHKHCIKNRSEIQVNTLCRGKLGEMV